MSDQATQSITTLASPVLVPRDQPLEKLFFVVVVLAIGILCFLALMAVLRAALPGLVRSAGQRLVASPWSTLAVGFAGYLVLGGAATWFFSRAFVRLLLTTLVVPGMLAAGIACAAVLLLLTFLGAPAMTGLLGRKLLAMGGGDSSELRETLWGSLAAVLASWFPGIGWVLVLPALLLFSFGAGARGLLGAERDRRA